MALFARASTEWHIAPAEMRYYTYIVKRDFGFAPNPWFGYCTLATCKPNIRASATVGNWVFGTGSKANNLNGYLIYAMKVTEKVTLNEYWNDPRFQQKKPEMFGSLKQMYGDNIYYYDPDKGIWHQSNSHHSNEDGSVNFDNLGNDTSKPCVLISSEFFYFGKDAIQIPEAFKDAFCHTTQGHKLVRDHVLANRFVEWLHENFEPGIIGFPLQFKGTFVRFKGK